MPGQVRSLNDPAPARPPQRLDDVVRPNPDGSFSIKDGTISLRLFAKPTSPTLRNLKQLVPKARRGKSPEYTNRLKIRLTASA